MKAKNLVTSDDLDYLQVGYLRVYACANKDFDYLHGALENIHANVSAKLEFEERHELAAMGPTTKAVRHKSKIKLCHASGYDGCIQLGDHCKLLFDSPHKRLEYLWVEVVAIVDNINNTIADRFIGMLDTNPRKVKIQPASAVEFRREHVVTCRPDDKTPQQTVH